MLPELALTMRIIRWPRFLRNWVAWRNTLSECGNVEFHAVHMVRLAVMPFLWRNMEFRKAHKLCLALSPLKVTTNNYRTIWTIGQLIIHDWIVKLDNERKRRIGQIFDERGRESFRTSSVEDCNKKSSGSHSSKKKLKNWRPSLISKLNLVTCLSLWGV